MDTVMMTNPLPGLEVAVVSPRCDDCASLLDGLNEFVARRHGDRSAVVILELTDYSIRAATPRHIKALSAWVAADVSGNRPRCDGVALVADADAMESVEAIWKLVARRGCLYSDWAVFLDVEPAYRWALRKFVVEQRGAEADGASFSSL